MLTILLTLVLYGAIIVSTKGEKYMNIYTVRFTHNGKKYAYRTTNFRMVKKVLKTFKNAWYGYYNTNDF